jgi:uncharacterized membrane protein
MLRILLTVHILAAIVFVGNIITAAFWKVRADRSGNLEAIALSTRAVLQADFAFTAPGILAVLGTGIAMAGITGWERFQEPWLALSFILFVITGFIWVAALLPLQVRMARLARQSAAQGSLDPAYQRSSKLWAIFGGIATTLPIIILFLMVLRPQF